MDTKKIIQKLELLKRLTENHLVLPCLESFSVHVGGEIKKNPAFALLKAFPAFFKLCSLSENNIVHYLQHAGNYLATK